MMMVVLVVVVGFWLWWLPLAYLFLAVSTYQMAVWAIKKHRNYKKEFGKEYPRGRKAMFPFVL